MQGVLGGAERYTRNRCEETVMSPYVSFEERFTLETGMRRLGGLDCMCWWRRQRFRDDVGGPTVLNFSAMAVKSKRGFGWSQCRDSHAHYKLLYHGSPGYPLRRSRWSICCSSPTLLMVLALISILSARIDILTSAGFTSTRGDAFLKYSQNKVLVSSASTRYVEETRLT